MKKAWLIPVCVFLAFGCDAADQIEAEIDCHSVCDRYAECFDANHDVSACQNDCENSIDSGDLAQSDLDECDNCIGDRSCASATFSCATECLGIVP
ncbi:MAG TPA: hypothetical protein VNN80_13500 [Polyangiaceae bacterium]|jgi:hypothetical protein|nr:hypothetical protein [Polyangiaceae bacterium]